ncbi:unnamed protein product [Schistosoma turkestanicum]|nr:unnamed protein product [Schistosoma turkestanicum]
MSLDIINLLNSAACDDLSVMLPASQQLTMVTQSGENCGNMCSAVASCVFSSDDRLSAGGRFLGLIYLKNMMFDSKIWDNIDLTVKKKVEMLLFDYISRGTENNFTNLVENTPQVSSIIAELTARYVKNEWLKSGWSDSLWQNLLDWHAWSSLRSGLKAAASFRLPARRHAFNNVIKKLLPSVISCFKDAIVDVEVNINPCIKLSKLLCSCLNLMCKNNVMTLDNSKEIFESTFMSTLLALELAFQSMLNTDKSPLMSVFRRRVSKLLFVLFLSCPSETRDYFAVPILEHVLAIVACSGYIQSSDKDANAVKWLLGITYSVLCSRSSKYAGQVNLTEQGKREVELWMSHSYQLPSGQISNKWTYFMMSLFEHWFLLTPNELQFLTSDPEGCLSSGGISSISVGHDAKTDSVYADLNSILNVDYQANELCARNIETIMGISDSSQHMLTPQPCRQLTELIFTIFCRLYEEANPILYEIVQSISAGTNKPLIFEAIMRLVQLCLPYFGTKANWISLADRLIADGLAVGDSIQDRIGLKPIEDEITAVTILTRTLSLLSRYSVQCIPPGDTEFSSLKPNCNNALLHINRYLNRPSNWDQNVLQKQLMMCIRLASAHSLMWFLEVTVFPEDILVLHAENLLNGTLFLIQDVKECETQIYVLTLLGKLIREIDLIAYPQFITPLLNTLNHLWSLSGFSAALRASILNAVCLLVTDFNGFNGCSTFLPEFNALIRSSVIHLIQMSLNQEEENEITGSEALFEPAIRLWASLVEGLNSTWSSDLINLMPILVGDSVRLMQTSGGQSINDTLKQPLLGRVDSGEQADLVFRIAYGTLRLAHKAGSEILKNFICQWSEPFWISILIVCLNGNSLGEQVNLEDLYSQAASSCIYDENKTDEESKYRINQLKLFIIWFTIYLDIQYSQQNITPLPSSAIGLVFLAAKYCLIRAPEDAHSDVTPKATECRLELLARLVLYPNMWSCFTYILQLVHKFSDNNNPTNLHLLLQEYYNSIGQQCYSTMDELRNLLSSPISRWLGRVDSLSSYIDRRCIAVAVITCFRQGVHSYTIGDHQILDAKYLEDLAVNDVWHAQWLEPVINLMIQVLYDKDEITTEDENMHFYHSYPIGISSLNNLKQRLRSELNLWQNQIGSPAIADALIKCHVDPALRVQLENQLNQIES